MHWKRKAVIMRWLSQLPAGAQLHYLMQKYVTRNLPLAQDHFETITQLARKHVAALDCDLQTAKFYEFGAGWDLIIPLAFYCLGVSHQIVIDLFPLAKPDLVNDTIERLQKLSFPRAPQKLLGRDWKSDLKNFYGIEYAAPCDARRTGLPRASVDCITSTNTLEHIPPDDIELIVKECAKLLKPSGKISFIIDYQDHYAYSDPSITVYNFLSFPESEWPKYSPPFHYQNRLRHADYRELFNSLRIDREIAVTPSAEDVALVSRLGHDKDAAIRGAHFVLSRA